MFGGVSPSAALSWQFSRWLLGPAELRSHEAPMRPLSPVGDVRLELSPPLPLPAVSGSPVGSSGRLMAASNSLVPDRLRLPLCFLGVFVCYFYYGILQEKM